MTQSINPAKVMEDLFKIATKDLAHARAIVTAIANNDLAQGSLTFGRLIFEVKRARDTEIVDFAFDILDQAIIPFQQADRGLKIAKWRDIVVFVGDDYSGIRDLAMWVALRLYPEKLTSSILLQHGMSSFRQKIRNKAREILLELNLSLHDLIRASRLTSGNLYVEALLEELGGNVQLYSGNRSMIELARRQPSSRFSETFAVMMCERLDEEERVNRFLANHNISSERN